MHFLIVDFEFTMHQRYGRPRVWFPKIIEVGAVVADGHGVLQDNVYNAFVKPQFWPRISKDCTGITGIHQRDIEQGISFEQMLQSLWQMSPTHLYNADFQDLWLITHFDKLKIGLEVCDI